MKMNKVTITTIIVAVLTALAGILSNAIELPSFISSYVWFLLPVLGVTLMLITSLQTQLHITTNPKSRRTILGVTLPVIVSTLALGTTIWIGSDKIAKEREVLAKEKREIEETRKTRLTKLRIGFLPQGDSISDRYNTRPLENNLASILKIDAQEVNAVYPGTTYTDTINALANKSTEMAWLAPLSYIVAKERLNVRLILSRQSTNASNTREYFSYIIAKRTSQIKSLQDLQGKPLAFVDEYSTSGHLIPLYELKKAGVQIDKKNSAYSLAHENVIRDVLNGNFVAGAISSNAYDEAVKKGKFKSEDMIIVHKSGAIPTGPIVVRSDIHHYDALRMQDALLEIEIDDPKIINTVGIAGFAKAIDKQYDDIRSIAKEVGIRYENAKE